MLGRSCEIECLHWLAPRWRCCECGTFYDSFEGMTRAYRVDTEHDWPGLYWPSISYALKHGTAGATQPATG